jgi:hypothetical protein
MPMNPALLAHLIILLLMKTAEIPCIFPDKQGILLRKVRARLRAQPTTDN